VITLVIVALLSFALGVASVVMRRRIRVARLHRELIQRGKLLDLRDVLAKGHERRHAEMRRDLRRSLGR
jgi:hypothetical protein